MANIRIDPTRQRDFLDLYYRWARPRLEAQLPKGGILAGVDLPIPIDHVPGELSFLNLPEEILDELRARNFPFTLIEP